jgi:hypothetical protein
MTNEIIGKIDYAKLIESYLLASIDYIKFNGRWFWVFLDDADGYKEFDKPEKNLHWDILHAAEDCERFINVTPLVPHFTLYKTRDKCINSSVFLLKNSPRNEQAKGMVREHMKLNNLIYKA